MKWLFFIAVVILTAMVAFGCVRIESGDEPVRIVSTESGLAGVVQRESVVEQRLRAMVKGSIYGTGEAVSVFGTCLNATDGGFPNSYGTLSAWYPNGTQFITDSAMQEMQVGYFLYTGTMDAVQGTYLTEFTCHINLTNVTAKAFGEWQNPLWVATINDTYGAVLNLSNNTQQWFNITWEKIDSVNASINESYYNLNQTLYYVASVANASVDRNDSYLAILLQLIASTIGAPQNYSLYVFEYPDDSLVFNRNWRMEVVVYNEYGQPVGSPVVGCKINTTNVPNTVNQSMIAEKAENAKNIPVDDREDFFYWQERIQTIGTFNWTVWCAYVSP